MMTLALHTLETLINAYLRLDEASIARLSLMRGKIIQLIIKDWDFSFFIVPTVDGIELHEKMNGPASTIIMGNLNALLRTALAKGSNAALFENNIEIEGDLDTGEAIRTILSDIDIDWEEHISKIIGDIAAHKLGITVHQLKTKLTTGSETLKKNLKEFLHIELRVLPTRDEMNDFSQDVSQLRHAVERLEARLQRLDQRKPN